MRGEHANGTMNGFELELRSLEERAEAAPPDIRGRALNAAGDRCVQAAELDRALRYYGRAIDVYLQIDRPRSAAAMCRKVLRVAPHVVRARRTLTLLAIGEGYIGDAHQQVEEYVGAAKQKGEHGLAVAVLRLMADLVGDGEFRGHLVEKLDELGDVATASRIADSAPSGAPADAPRPTATGGLNDASDDQRWERVLRVALMGPDRLREEGGTS